MYFKSVYSYIQASGSLLPAPPSDIFIAQIILTRRVSPFRVLKEITPASRLFVEAASIQSGVNFHAGNYSFINKGSTSSTENTSRLDGPHMAK
jgi:hypothetical protein